MFRQHRDNRDIISIHLSVISLLSCHQPVVLFSLLRLGPLSVSTDYLRNPALSTDILICRLKNFPVCSVLTAKLTLTAHKKPFVLCAILIYCRIELWNIVVTYPKWVSIEVTIMCDLFGAKFVSFHICCVSDSVLNVTFTVVSYFISTVCSIINGGPKKKYYIRQLHHWLVQLLYSRWIGNACIIRPVCSGFLLVII